MTTVRPAAVVILDDATFEKPNGGSYKTLAIDDEAGGGIVARVTAAVAEAEAVAFEDRTNTLREEVVALITEYVLAALNVTDNKPPVLRLSKLSDHELNELIETAARVAKKDSVISVPPGKWSRRYVKLISALHELRELRERITSPR